MKLCWCTIRVDDMDKSLSFYQDIVGLPLINKMEREDTKICFLGDGDTKIELLYDVNYKGNSGAIHGISIGFEVSSVEDKMKSLKQRGIETSDIIQPNSHVKFFFVKDPNGVSLQFVENM